MSVCGGNWALSKQVLGPLIPLLKALFKVSLSTHGDPYWCQGSSPWGPAKLLVQPQSCSGSWKAWASHQGGLGCPQWLVPGANRKGQLQDPLIACHFCGRSQQMWIPLIHEEEGVERGREENLELRLCSPWNWYCGVKYVRCALGNCSVPAALRGFIFFFFMDHFFSDKPSREGSADQIHHNLSSCSEWRLTWVCFAIYSLWTDLYMTLFRLNINLRILAQIIWGCWLCRALPLVHEDKVGHCKLAPLFLRSPALWSGREICVLQDTVMFCLPKPHRRKALIAQRVLWPNQPWTGWGPCVENSKDILTPLLRPLFSKLPL